MLDIKSCLIILAIILIIIVFIRKRQRFSDNTIFLLPSESIKDESEKIEITFGPDKSIKIESGLDNGWSVFIPSEVAKYYNNYGEFSCLVIEPDKSEISVYGGPNFDDMKFIETALSFKKDFHHLTKFISNLKR